MIGTGRAASLSLSLSDPDCPVGTLMKTKQQQHLGAEVCMYV